MATRSKVLNLVTLIIILSSQLITTHSLQGKWKLLRRSIGISAMHMALLPNDKIIVFDRTNSGPSNLTLPASKCSKADDGDADAEKIGCFAHSAEFDASQRAVRPLNILTDTWCSSGALSHDGVLIQTGGYEAGERVVRYIDACSDCDWVEEPNGLISSRWYATNQVLPDGKIIVVGGRLQFSYEFVPKSSGRKLYEFPFLEETRYSAKVPNNLYPFLHLAPDGNLFVFANDRAILLDYVGNKIVRKFPAMPGEEGGAVARNYPSTGSSALLPITLSRNGTGYSDVVVLVCGGTVPESNVKANAGDFVLAARSCGRLVITTEEPSWEMEMMPVERVMGDMIMLPTGDVLIINGARRGTAGWNAAREPVLSPVLYRTGNKHEERFEVMTASMIPRLYHSTAHLLSDGRVLVGGSNPNRNYNFSTIFPTELSIEAFYPPYMTESETATPRPAINSVKPGAVITYGEKISVQFRSKNPSLESENDQIYVTMVAPSFTTHSLAMNQRLLVLDIGQVRRGKSGCDYVAEGYAPATPELAPPGYYLLFVVVDGVPSRGMWVRIK